MTSLNSRLCIAFILALILTILPMPEFLVGIRPPWVLLLVLYLQLYMPDYFNLIVLFLLGLILDVLLSTVIGEHTFALFLVTWAASNKARRFYCFSIAQQMTLIGFFSLMYQLTIVIIDAFLGFHVAFISVLGSSMMSVILWPWIRLISEDTLLVKVRYQRS